MLDESEFEDLTLDELNNVLESNLQNPEFVKTWVEMTEEVLKKHMAVTFAARQVCAHASVDNVNQLKVSLAELDGKKSDILIATQ